MTCTICKQLICLGSKSNAAGFVRGTEFCATACPDADMIPDDCAQSCGWPWRAMFTGYKRRNKFIPDACPNATPQRCACCQDDAQRFALWEAYLAKRARDFERQRQERTPGERVNAH